MLSKYLPQEVNRGRWVTAYTLNFLRELPPDTQFTLPIASLGTPAEEYDELGNWLLPPLFHEALEGPHKEAILDRIRRCFPSYAEPTQNESRLRIVELLRRSPVTADETSPLVAFSVDTAVEEHGPHLPLATDTIQSYGVLHALSEKHGPKMSIVQPVEYGQLTWGLPFGFSIDLTADLLTTYVTHFANAIQAWLRPEAMYVVDVHGSIVHRRAIVDGLRQSNASHWGFRWLHEPLAEFSSQRNDQHAGGVETALVEHLNPALLDSNWWPARFAEIAEKQMSLATAVELTPDLDRFIAYVKSNGSNGIVGGIENYPSLDAADLFRRMLTVASDDVDHLLRGGTIDVAGVDLW
jgi:creatinine amidohydrolase/Fe(II)-dependent formamide hydrolase-like protein